MSAPSKPEPDSGNFLDKILSIFVGMGDPDSDKKKILRAIAKDLTRSRYKFLKPKGNEALPGIARFFFELYKITAPAQMQLQSASGSSALRTFVIESHLTAEKKALTERLSESYIIEKSKTLDIKKLSEQCQTDLATFLANFDGDKTKEIDAAFNTLLSLANFVNFDFYFLLKKFDSSIPERNFSYKPKFEAINAEYIADDLADFLEVFMSLDLEADWERIFIMMRDFRDADIIQIETWNKITPICLDIRRSLILEQVVRFVKKDPYWSIQPRYPNERIVEPYIQKLKAQVETLIHRINAERRNAKIDEVAVQVFGTNIVVRMKNYTEKANVVFAKKMLGGYTQVTALNYLKAYLIDYFKKDIREIVDILLIRGKWTTGVQSQQLSDAYHALMEVSTKLLAFDDSLADDAEMGAKLRQALAKSDRDKEQLKYLRTMLKDVNDQAVAFVTRAMVNLIQVGRQFKSLLEDQGKVGRHEQIMNWKEIENLGEVPLKDHMTAAYKKIYYIIQLLQNFMKKGAADPE
ncbi:MAG: DUF5312 family protein [Spirochaetota bacterium]